MDNNRDAERRKSATDPIFKQVMLTLFQGWEVNIQTEVKVLSHPGFGFQKIGEGYYLCHAFDVPVYLIATNELPLEPMYHSLLLFASSEVKIQPIVEDILKKGQFFVFLSLLHLKLAEEALVMAKRRDRIEENLKILAEGLGPRLVPYIAPEDRLRDLTPDQLLAGLDVDQLLARLDAEQRLAGLSLEDRINGLSDEDRQALRQLLDDQDNGP